MPVLIDGSNLLHALGLSAPSREEVRRRVLDRVRRERMRVTVVFDGPPPAGTPSRESLGPVTVVYSAPASADDVIVRALPEGPAARSWTVVTDDRGLAARVRRRGAQVRTLAHWRQGDRAPGHPSRGDGLRPDEVAEWELWFARRGRPEDP